jgi:hypothetical protein
MRPIRLELSAVILALAEGEGRLEPCVATVPGPAGPDLPTAAFDPDEHRTLELSLRDWVAHAAGLTLGHVEQLYTFGDRARLGLAGPDDPHLVSIGYLALTRPQAAAGGAVGWTPWARHFPWEDRRRGPAMADALDAPLRAWAAEAPERRLDRVRVCFGLDGAPWAPELTLERYETLYAARLVREAWRDRGRDPPDDLPPLGAPLPRDHRRILATAIGRLRGKVKWRPVLFELTPPAFTLYDLQQAAEAVSGVTLHKQNFRRQVEGSGLVEPTGAASSRRGGRPAAEFRYAPAATSERRAAKAQTGAPS